MYADAAPTMTSGRGGVVEKRAQVVEHRAEPDDRRPERRRRARSPGRRTPASSRSSRRSAAGVGGQAGAEMLRQHRRAARSASGTLTSRVSAQTPTSSAGAPVDAAHAVDATRQAVMREPPTTAGSPAARPSTSATTSSPRGRPCGSQRPRVVGVVDVEQQHAVRIDLRGRPPATADRRL